MAYIFLGLQSRFYPTLKENNFINISHIFYFSKYQIIAQFFKYSTIYMLHYTPQHVSSSTLLIIMVF